MNRKNQILAAVLALQIVIAAIVFWPRSPASASGTPLLPALSVDKVTRLAISDGSGQQVQLTKGASGWVLPQADDYPCQEDKITTLLNKVAGLKTDRLVARTSASQKPLKVAEEAFERAIDIEQDDGQQLHLYLGVAVGYQASHVRVQGQDEVYLAADLSTADVSARASGWVDTRYLTVPQEQMSHLVVQNAKGRLEFDKDAGGTWSMVGLEAGETLNSASVETLVFYASAISMLQPLGKHEQESYGMQAPSAVVTMEAKDQAGTAKTYTLRVGAKDAQDSSYVVISSESPYYVRVAEYAVQDLVAKARADFLQVPPTAEPTLAP